MIIVYDSKTGNVEKFVNKLNVPVVKIEDSLIISEPFILITFTTGIGKIPETTAEFLKNNYKNLLAVASSGNRNWGDMFAASADKISSIYSIPVIHKFELAGYPSDVDIVLRIYDEMRKMYDDIK
jgi:protein involved in ribonucleotide reduction